MNIDTLRRSDNTYRAAEYIDVARCLNADHVTHLQRDSVVVAIRPAVDNGRPGWEVTLAPNGISRTSKFFPKHEQLRVIRNVLRFLNGTENSYETGDTTTVEANQGEREAEVLATSGNQMLVEYLMPNGTSALRIITVCGRRFIDQRSVPYRNVPKKWVRAMHEQGTTLWEGRCQRSRNPVPFPTL
jgi:hypothetical protein